MFLRGTTQTSDSYSFVFGLYLGNVNTTRLLSTAKVSSPSQDTVNIITYMQ